MKNCTVLFVVWCVLWTPPVPADDIDIYLRRAPLGGDAYVHLMLDYSAQMFRPLCFYGSTCRVAAADGSCPLGTCFSLEAYNKLGAATAARHGDVVTRFDGLVAVLDTLFLDSLFSDINVALLVSNFDNGGTFLEGYRALGSHYDPAQAQVPEVSPGTPGAVTGAEKLVSTLRSIPVPGGASAAHPLQPKESYFEWFRYLNGGDVVYGDRTGGNFSALGNAPRAPNSDPSIFAASGQRYRSPFSDPDACAKLFSILVATQAASSDDSLDGIIASPGYPGLDIGLRGKFEFDEFLRAVRDSDKDLVNDSLMKGVNRLEKTWIVSDSATGTLAREWARAGSGDPPLNLESPSQLEQGLTRAFMEVANTSSTWVVAGAPANLLHRTQVGQNLYLAQMAAEAGQNWAGNIKKMKLQDVDGDGNFDKIIDASVPHPKPGMDATAATGARIAFDALSFWTIPAALPAIAERSAPAMADGRVVKRGGAGQKITGFVAGGQQAIGDSNSSAGPIRHRQVFVEPASFTNGVATAFDEFNADSLTLGLQGIKAALGDVSMSDTHALELIRWGRGQDGSGDSFGSRPWILSESIHSRVLAINYGSVGGYSVANPNIRLFFGTGDGLFHALQDSTPAAVESGEELFAFYPRELLGNIEVRKTNTASGLKLRYGVDGSAVALLVDNNGDGNLVASGSSPNGGDEAYVYFGLRRGGNSYYALDVSDPGSRPTLKWKISRTPGGDFDELGLTFSRPVVGKVNFDGTARDVVIFGGGYHGGWDADYTRRLGKDLNANPDDTVGNAIYVVDARTGALVWKASMGVAAATSTEYQHPQLEDGIPSGITALENAAGIIERLYVGDTGGAVWRVDLPSMNTDLRASRWFVSKLAELGNDGATAASDRRFFHAPDVVQSFDEEGSFDGLVISSGDRAHPNETTVSNYHFYIKDRAITSGDTAVLARAPILASGASAPVDLPDQTLCVRGDESSCAASLPNGWKIKLTYSGEKGLATALVDGGRVFLSTFVPGGSAQSCAPSQGRGLVYLVNLDDGTATYKDRIYEIGLGIPSEVIAVGDGILLPGAGIEPENPGDPNDTPCKGNFCDSLKDKVHRVYWREMDVDTL